MQAVKQCKCNDFEFIFLEINHTFMTYSIHFTHQHSISLSHKRRVLENPLGIECSQDRVKL